MTTPKKSNVRIKRYANPETVGYKMTVEADDQSWMVFVAKDGAASLWIGVEAPADEKDELGEGDTIHAYMPAAVHDWLAKNPPGTPMPQYLADLMGAERV